MIRAVITDLDRTLLRTDKSVSAYTLSVLQKCRDRGILLMAATARPERAVTDYHRQIGFHAIATLNGARVLLPHGAVENGIDPADAESILKRVIALPGLVLSLETENGLFSNVPLPEWNAVVFSGFPALPTDGVIYKLLLSSEAADIRPEVEAALTKNTYMTVAGGQLIQVMSAAATKWNGVRLMLEAAGVTPGEAVFFGDDYDDLEPLKRCGVGVAVANAIGEALDAADFIAPGNDMDGVARYLEAHLLPSDG